MTIHGPSEVISVHCVLKEGCKMELCLRNLTVLISKLVIQRYFQLIDVSAGGAG